MIPYRGRSTHKVKLKNKPIQEGYKVWILGDNGYALDWLWHSKEDGPESLHKSLEVPIRVSTGFETVKLAPTFALVIQLARRLRAIYSDRVFCFYLDNLFLNLNVAQALLALNICCMGTTRKNAQGMPS
jgi:Transposase IS4